MVWNINVRGPARHGLAVAVCALTTAATLPLLGVVDLANIVLLFVLAVVLVATFLGRGPAVLASFVAVACFDFFFVPPRFSFSVAHSQYLITFAVMLVVSLIISQLTNAYREKAGESARRADESALLHELAEALAGAPTHTEASARLQALARHRLNAGAALLLPDDAGRLFEVAPENAPPEHLDRVEHTAAQAVFLSGHGTATVGELRDGALTALQPLEGSTRRRGVLAIHFRAADGAPDATLVKAMAAVVATAVERLHFVEVAHAASLETQSERLRNSILAALSHDLRTPLTVLYALADALASDPALAGEARDTASTLRDQSHRLHRMVDNLLDLARIKSGRIAPQRDWQSVPELVAAGAQSLAPWLDPARLRFAWPADLPLIELDPVLIERVFCNLLENAVKYSPPDSPIELGARVLTASDGPDATDRLEVWIDNGGPGFPPERLDRVFTMFERGAAESTVPGVGIGLAVCQAVVAAHGGRIAAENRPTGARLRFDLPLRAAPALPVESEAEAA